MDILVFHSYSPTLHRFFAVFPLWPPPWVTWWVQAPAAPWEEAWPAPPRPEKYVRHGGFMGKTIGNHWNIWGKPWENMRKSWENHGKNHRKSLENMGKPMENHGKIWDNHGKNNRTSSEHMGKSLENPTIKKDNGFLSRVPLASSSRHGWPWRLVLKPMVTWGWVRIQEVNHPFLGILKFDPYPSDSKIWRLVKTYMKLYTI